MRLCRFVHQGRLQAGFYTETAVVPLVEAAKAWAAAAGQPAPPWEGDDLLAYLPPDGPHHASALRAAQWLAAMPQVQQQFAIPASDVEWRLPIERPSKLLLLAGNYNEHIQEGGGAATERAETFPYVFMKPPSTTLRAHRQAVILPRVSPHHIDWELELAVVIGRRARHVTESEALNYVAGYTICNDISDREFHPNPHRKPRPNDKWFDWEHGKWHDTFCPCGPCIASTDAISDPQKLRMRLTVNGAVKQQATTAQQIFPVAAVVAFISDILTLEPGDIISTGTPSGVGHSRGTYLQPGDWVEAWIEGIGTLASPVVAESAA